MQESSPSLASARIALVREGRGHRPFDHRIPLPGLRMRRDFKDYQIPRLFSLASHRAHLLPRTSNRRMVHIYALTPLVDCRLELLMLPAPLASTPAGRRRGGEWKQTEISLHNQALPFVVTPPMGVIMDGSA